jgi:carbamoyl-phosphate synthase small subunit
MNLQRHTVSRIKNNIIRNLIRRRLKVVVVPYNYTYEQIMTFNPKGVVISNGPGDPKLCVEAIEVGKKLIAESFPTLGVCLGNQILGLSAGGDTYKLKYGHRGANKPVIDERTGRAYITSQNHGYAVDVESISGSGFKLLFRNLDDNSCEGMYHPTKPIFSSQFHPEAYPGPEDTNWIFDVFMQHMGLKT